MASYDVLNVTYPVCNTDLLVKTSYGIYPVRSIETADCPVCGKEVLRKIEIKVESLANAKEQYKVALKQRNI